MIVYLDASALVKAYVTESHSEQILPLMVQAKAVASHMIAFVEARAAFARLHREGIFNDKQWEVVKGEFIQDWNDYVQISTSKPLIERASEFAEVFALRGYDSVHLAAADLLYQRVKRDFLFACFDSKLNRAAALLGFRILNV